MKNEKLLQELRQEALMLQERQDENETEFLKTYNKNVKIFNQKIIPEMKNILMWIIENKEKHNFILLEGSLGKASRFEFQEKTDKLKSLIDQKIYFNFRNAYNTLSINTSFSIRGKDTENDYNRWIKINVNVSYYSHKSIDVDKRYDQTILEPVTFSQVKKILEQTKKLDQQIAKLEKKRNDLLNNKEQVLNVYHYVNKKYFR